MALPKAKAQEYYTYDDYCTWEDGERWELIDGVAYAMSPAPTWRHQKVSVKLLAQLLEFLRDKPCEVFHAPFDVRLNAEAGDDTVVQPDIVVICDRSKLSGTGCIGAPDMVIEILSPGTARHDRLVKFRLYQNAGVREYWIVDPDDRIVCVHLLKDGGYITRAFGEADRVPVSVLDGLLIDTADLFADMW